MKCERISRKPTLPTVTIVYSQTMQRTTGRSPCDIAIPFQFGWETEVAQNDAVTVEEYLDLGYHRWDGILLPSEQTNLIEILKTAAGDVELPADRPCIEEVGIQYPGDPYATFTRWGWPDRSLPRKIYLLSLALESLRKRVATPPWPLE